MLCGCLNACFKPVNKYIDQETKDYCLFAEGSYWIYQDSTTHAIDSVIINSIRYEIYHSEGDGSELENYFTYLSLYSQDNMRNFRVSLGAHFSERNNSSSCRLYFDYDVIYHNGKINENSYEHRNTILIDKKDNYSINSVNYANVKVFKYSQSGSERLFYSAKHVGMIRNEIKFKSIYTGADTSIVKNLIKYNVNPYKQ